MFLFLFAVFSFFIEKSTGVPMFLFEPINKLLIARDVFAAFLVGLALLIGVFFVLTMF